MKDDKADAQDESDDHCYGLHGCSEVEVSDGNRAIL
jgi:hypothetical protein